MTWEETKKRDAERAREMFAETELVDVTAPDAAVRAFYLKKPGTRMGSIMLVFTPEGTALLGDMAQRGWTPARGGYRGLGWFLCRPHGHYLLCEFLDRKCIPEAAAADLREHVAEVLEHPGVFEEGLAAKYRAVADWIDSERYEPYEFESELYDRMSDIGPVDDGLPGWTYPSFDAALLEAIVDRFCDLYDAHQASCCTKPTDAKRFGRPVCTKCGSYVDVAVAS